MKIKFVFYFKLIIYQINAIIHVTNVLLQMIKINV